MEMDKCYRCSCSYCGNEACDDWCEMKEHCSHDPVVECSNFKADESEFGVRHSRYQACRYSLLAIEDHQAGKWVDWEDVKKVLRLVLDGLID